MKRITLIYLVLIACLFTGCQQKTLEIYVSVEGNDSSTGDKTDPVKTLGKAVKLVAENAGKKAINVRVEDGIYYLPQTLVLNAQNSGTEKYPVKFSAVNENKVIISGGEKLNLDWTPFKDGIYKATVSGDVTIDQLYVNGKRQRMARFPNAVEGKNVFDTWDLIHTREPDPINDPLNAERVANWESPEGAFVHAMHTALWGDMHWLIKGVKEDGTLELEGGWQNNRPSPMHPRYRMVENVFEELDVPGEWFYKRSEKTLYYFPLEGEDINEAKIEIVRLKHLIEFDGTKEAPVKFVKLDGFVFRHAARSFMENKEQLLRSDWTTYRGGAILLNGAEDCVIENCEFDQVGGNSIFVNNYNRRISVKSCYIHDSGANGVAFVGDPNTVRSPLFRYGKQDFKNIDRTRGPKGDNFPEDCLVEDCLITMTGRDEKQTSPVQISMSHKIRVNHCSLYDVPRAGINISEGTFGGHIIENCDVFNTVLETGDHGSFNSWGRDRFWTPDIKQTDAEVKKVPDLPKYDMLEKNIIRNSRWRCDHGWDIDLDDGSTWYELYNNVLLNGGLKMREGYFRTATNNVIINNSFHPHVWYPESGDIFKGNIVFGAYRPAAMKRALAVDDKWGAVIDSNLFATHENDRLKFAKNGCDANSVVGDPLFEDAATMNYQVKENSPALGLGFKNFPMNEFGVVSEKLKKLAKVPEIPVVVTFQTSESGKIHDWKGAKAKNIETLGEQSAAGLSSISGVALLEVPKNSELARFGFQTGDVILKCGNNEIKNYSQLMQEMKKAKGQKEIGITIMHNQAIKEIVTDVGTKQEPEANNLDKGTILVINSLTNAGIFQTPVFEFTNQFDQYKPYQNIKGLFFDGLDFHGKPTKVFCWYGIPETLAEGEKVPAVVLAHGGGGTVFPEWIKKWTDRGYAAISIALEGQVPGPKDPNSRHPDHEFSGPSRKGFFMDIKYEELEDQWFYHAVADIILANSLLRSFPEIDATKIGITGISWGGILTNVVTGIDNRFAFSIPVYGCGYLYESPCYIKQLKAHTEKSRKLYMETWEPSLYIPLQKQPTLFVNGTNDYHFPMNSFTKTYQASNSEKYLHVEHEMKHGHRFGWSPEVIYSFADYVTTGEGVPPKFSIYNNSIAYEGMVSDATLYYTTDTVDWIDKNYKWTESGAIIINTSEKKIGFNLPKDAVYYFLNVSSDKGEVYSTQMRKKH